MHRPDHVRSREGCVLFSTAIATDWYGSNHVSGEKQSSQHLLYEKVPLPEALEFFAPTCRGRTAEGTRASYRYSCRQDGSSRGSSQDERSFCLYNSSQACSPIVALKLRDALIVATRALWPGTGFNHFYVLPLPNSQTFDLYPITLLGREWVAKRFGSPSADCPYGQQPGPAGIVRS